MTPMERIESELSDAQKRIAELERDRDAYRTAEEAQIVLRQKLEAERDALAAHLERITEARNSNRGDTLANICAVIDEATHQTSLARRDAIKQVEAMRHVAKWLSGEIEESCIGLDFGGEIAGPTRCSDADKCRVAGERIFREAARIWECRYVTEAKQ